MSERTLMMIKPDSVRRGLIGEILSRVENKGLKILALKMIQFDKALADQFYAEHLEKPFYPELMGFMTSGPAIAMALSGPSAIALTRGMMGATKFTDAVPGTIRGDFAHDLTANCVHGSDSPESAEREIGILFDTAEIVAAGE